MVYFSSKRCLSMVYRPIAPFNYICTLEETNGVELRSKVVLICGMIA